MDTFHRTPQSICDEMAFQSTAVQDLFRRFGSKPFFTGPYTPWPIRAEAAVRVFKATLHDLCDLIGTLPELKQVVVRELLRNKSRSSEELHGDVWRKTLVELVFGRKPRDIVTIDNSSLEQLSVPVTELDLMDQTFQQLAMKSCLEARQRADLRRDIAARLRPTEGHFRPGDRVYYWQIDKKHT